MGFVILEYPGIFCSAPENWVVSAEAAAMVTAMAAVMAAANAMATAATTAVAAAMATASDSCIEGMYVVDAAAGAITGSTTAVKASAR